MAVRPELSPASTVLLYTASPFFLGTSGNNSCLALFLKKNIYLLPSLLELPISIALVSSYGPSWGSGSMCHFQLFSLLSFSTRAVAWLLPSLPGTRYSFGAFFFSEPFPECDDPLMTNLCLDPQTPYLSWVAYSCFQVTLQVDGLKVGMSRPHPSPRMSLNSMVAVTAQCICITEKSITFLL